FADVLYVQHRTTYTLYVVAELAHRKAIGCEGIDVAKDITELVIKADACQRVGKGAADIVDVLADLIEQLRQLFGVSPILEHHEYGRLTGNGVAARIIQRIDLLDFFLNTVGDLIQRVADRSARPLGDDDHGLDRKRGILLAAKVAIGDHTHNDRSNHQEQNERAVPERPFRQIEACHG